MKKLIAIVMGGCLLTALLTASYADTSRLGGKNISFNPLRVVAKTAAYTVTTSDGEVDVTCTSANIAITLPAISGLGPGKYAFKIKKADSTAYSVIVTPATGDTVGGESTRYITKQNDYVVVTSGPGSDWTVSFESPLVAEDYEAGTVTVPNITVNGSTTSSGAVSGTTGTFTGLGTFGNGTTIKLKTNGTIEFEGATANDYETVVSPTDPTADRTITIPDASGAPVLTTLTTNAPDAANSVTGTSNGIVFEGATANDYETTFSPTDPTADRAITIPNGAGTIALTNAAATQTFTIMTTTINGITRNIPAY